MLLVQSMYSNSTLFFLISEQSERNWQKAKVMQGTEWKLKLAESKEMQTNDFDHRGNRQHYLHMPRTRRGEGSKSSPLSTRYLKPPALSLRSRSEGNLIIAAQTIDLKSQQEFGVHPESTAVQLPRLHRDSPSNIGLNHERKQIKKGPRPVKEISINNNALNSRPLAILRDIDRKRMLKQHIVQEENEYQANETKRHSLLRWLKQQNVSN